jgi:ubiquinone biosynthesis protein
MSGIAGAGWLDRVPGLTGTARRWLSERDDLRAAAARRADGILATPLYSPDSVMRLARLGRASAPRLLPAVAARDGEAAVAALAAVALRGGPTFVKLGQFIGSSRGLVPEWVADAFAACRDAVPPASPASVAATLARSGVDGRLRSWEEQPIASASVAQVHAAVLHDGRDVVVKVRRPGIVRQVSADAGYLLPALRLVESRDRRFRMANVSGILELMVRLFAEEVDFRLEAAGMIEMALALEEAGVDVRVPAPIPGLVTKRVLVMERIHGHSAADPAAATDDPVALIRVAIAGVLETTLRRGIFHGDLHPGNVLVTADGLALVDFGIIGRLATFDRHSLFAALQRFGALPADADVEAVIAALPDPPSAADLPALMADRKAAMARLGLVVRALSGAGFQVPPELALFARNVSYLADAVERHAPDFDIIGEVVQIAAAALG